MKIFRFKKIDAFAKGFSSGNPAGAVYYDNNSDINKDEMLKIALELKGFVNEVAFIMRISDSKFSLRYFSAESEIDFCGHATIAVMYDLFKSTDEFLNKDLLTISTNKGELSIINRICDENAIFIMAPLPEYRTDIPTIVDICTNLKIEDTDIHPQYPISIINAGLTTLLVPIKSLECILGISPDFNSLKEFCESANIDIIEVFTDKVSNSNNHFRTRVFAPTCGYLEDPATGSGNSALGYYLFNLGKWNYDTLNIEQNNEVNNFNSIKLIKSNDESNNFRVFFGGSAITRLVGDYFLF